MNDIKLVALDVDGTLLDDKKQLPAENARALVAAHEAGVAIAIASGRMTPRIEAVQDLLGIDCMVIAYNGAKLLTTRAEGREVVHHEPLSADVAGELFQFAEQSNHLLNVYHEDQLYAVARPEHADLMSLYCARTGAQYRTVDSYSEFEGLAPTKLLLMADPEECLRVQNTLRPRYAERANLLRSDPEYLEIMSPAVNKGAALHRLAALLQLNVMQVMAVGDAENDVDLLRTAGLGVAIANASDGAKAAADVVTSRSNNSGGVAEALQRWVLA